MCCGRPGVTPMARATLNAPVQIEGGVSLRYLGAMLNISMQTKNRNTYSFSATAREFQVKPEDVEWFINIRERGRILFEVVQSPPQETPLQEVPPQVGIAAEPTPEVPSFTAVEVEVADDHATTQDDSSDTHPEDSTAKRKQKRYGRTPS